MAAESAIYEDALVAARDYSTDALLAFADAFGFIVADQELDPVERRLASERLRAVRAELERRERLARLQSSLASPSDRRYEQWRQLAQLVRERADMLRVLDLCGYHVTRTSKREAHAACPACGTGEDRLVITAGPPDLCWCRRCHWGGDVITLTMSLRQCGFRDAVAWLAGLVGGQRAA